jgi:toxin HigB-1
VPQAHRGLGLGQKAAERRLVTGQPGHQLLDGHLFAQKGVLGQVDGAEAAAAEGPPDLARRALRRSEYIHLANDLSDLKVLPSNRLHSLRGDREGQYSISINDQWRICFRWVDDDAYDVEITDYH